MRKYRVQRHAIIQPLDKPFRYIPLTQGLNAIVDTKDFDWLNQWNWSAFFLDGNYRVVRRKNGKLVYMYREILGCQKKTEEGDHWNHDTLDNRRENLRRATRVENCHNRRKQRNNTSGYIGVYWHQGASKWLAQIVENGKWIYIGIFADLVEAAHAYDQAAKKYHGEFAYLNFP